MVSVICLGIAVLDEIFAVGEIPTRPGKYFASDYRSIGGGGGGGDGRPDGVVGARRRG
jgi:hypothetical protein